MESLCLQDGGVTVYEAVTLSTNEFNKDGVPLARYWLDPTLAGTTSRLGPNYHYVYRAEVLKAGDPMRGEGRLTRYVEEIHRATDGRLLAKSVSYGRAGGDFIVLEHFSTAGCPSSKKPFLTAVFLKAK